jgi:hypothetical protein
VSALFGRRSRLSAVPFSAESDGTSPAGNGYSAEKGRRGGFCGLLRAALESFDDALEPPMLYLTRPEIDAYLEEGIAPAWIEQNVVEVPYP